MKGIYILLAFIPSLLTGCIQAPIAPNLKLPDRSIKECPQAKLPPIPDKVTIKIDGKKVEVDEGGDRLLRNYVIARELLK